MKCMLAMTASGKVPECICASAKTLPPTGLSWVNDTLRCDCLSAGGTVQLLVNLPGFEGRGDVGEFTNGHRPSRPVRFSRRAYVGGHGVCSDYSAESEPGETLCVDPEPNRWSTG